MKRSSGVKGLKKKKHCLKLIVFSLQRGCLKEDQGLVIQTSSFNSFAFITLRTRDKHEIKEINNPCPGSALTKTCFVCCCRYRRVVTRRRAGLAVVICWTVAFIVGLTPMLGWNNLRRLQQNGSISSDLVITCQFENVISMDYMVYFNFFGWVLPPLLFMLVLYAEIFYMIHKQLNNKKITANHTEPNRYYDKELNLAKSLVLVLFLFAVSWLPLHIINCITLFCPECQKPIVLLYIAILLTHGNSAVNPIVYAFRIKRFRSAFRKIWQQYVCCKETPGLDFQPSDRKEMPILVPHQITPVDTSQMEDLKCHLAQQQELSPQSQEDQKTETPQ